MTLRLTDHEIIDLTGYKQPASQIRWLKRYGFRFFVTADGHPRVLRCDLETTTKTPEQGPNLAALPRQSKV